ncbi:hypothetical protein [Edwardsiella ictaluri]|uniref:hypothetical protein n=1 Tax=Edwardsiella ictaluri TaxID=67780 RepID=UPI00259D0E62|nr:hypothetical protein [Edwardsiella ictaluri]
MFDRQRIAVRLRYLLSPGRKIDRRRQQRTVKQRQIGRFGRRLNQAGFEPLFGGFVMVIVLMLTIIVIGGVSRVLVLTVISPISVFP